MTAGIYIHIPFCRSRCSYCDFATDVYKSADAVERYVSALVREIEEFDRLKTIPPIEGMDDAACVFRIPPLVETIYFGGGTPSLLTPEQVDRILNKLRRAFVLSTDIYPEEKLEITMEMNPATVTPETLRGYREAGVNRASFGAQTFDDTELKRLGRRHTAADVRETVELLRGAGFANVSFDLIAGLPRQTLKDWERNLDEALRLAPEHLSLYLLEIHEATPLAEQIRTGRQPLPDEELAAEMYETLLEKTRAAGFHQYEISNFSRAGFESRHNSKYWTLDPVFGFGCSAHSFDGERRRWSNARDTLEYVRLIEAGRSPIVEETVIDPQSETVFLGLRLTRGVDLNAYEKRFGADLRAEYAEELARLEEAELIEFEENRLRLTAKGFLYSNEVFAVFV